MMPIMRLRPSSKPSECNELPGRPLVNLAASSNPTKGGEFL